MSGQWVEVGPGRKRFIHDREPMPMGARSDLPMPFVVSDLPAYSSPLGDGVIDGRSARREHFKRTNTREVDPSEWRERSAQFQSEKAEKQAVADAWKAGKDIHRGTA